MKRFSCLVYLGSSLVASTERVVDFLKRCDLASPAESFTSADGRIADQTWTPAAR